MSATEIGHRLRQARQARGLDLATAAKSTHIRGHYLKALEEGEFGLLPSPAQVRGFIRTYANYLDLNPDELFALLKPKTAESPVETTETTPVITSVAAGAETAAAFAEIGAELRARRENLELTLTEVEENTHLPEHYLQRLEQGDFDSFPSPTQARGMLSNYADFLGLESEALISRYAEALQWRFQVRQAAKPAPRRFTRPKLPKLKYRFPDWAAPLLSRDVMFGGIVGLALIVFVIFSIGRIAATSAAQEPELTAPPLLDVFSGATPTLGTTTPIGATQDPINLVQQQTQAPGFVGEATIAIAEGRALGVRVLATQRTWMRVTVDGQTQFEGRTEPGQNYTFNASNQIFLLTGNGSALRIFFNEQDLGILGIYGEVVSVVFTAQGAATPTLSPTPTIDPNILTSTADAALTPSATPSATTTSTPTPTPTVDAAEASP